MAVLTRPLSKPYGFVAALIAATLLFLVHRGFSGDPTCIPGASLDDIYNSTLGFDTIFVISLPSRTDRRDGITLAAALSGIRVEFVDGLQGSQVPDEAIPSHPGQGRMGEASIGSWRGHMNAVGEVVRRNLTSALILEDDVDWDVRLKRQLRDFAAASRALTQPLAATPWDRTTSRDDEVELQRAGPPPTVPPTSSPYGDAWDVLWLGHCGMTFPYADGSVPKGRAVLADDPTVPEKRHLTTWTDPDELKAQYPEHARVAHHAQSGLCSLGYGVSRRGARMLLREVGLGPFDEAFDLELGKFCDESGGGEGKGGEGGGKTCLSVQPSLFNNHLPVGPRSAESDISDHGEGWADVASTPNTRWSTRLNAGALLGGGELVDQFPDAADEVVVQDYREGW